MLLNGWVDLAEVEANFVVDGTVIYGDKFIDNDMNLSGCIITQDTNGFYHVITRANIDYGTQNNKYDSMSFNLDDVFYNLKFSMYNVQSISIKDLKFLLLGL